MCEHFCHTLYIVQYQYRYAMRMEEECNFGILMNQYEFLNILLFADYKVSIQDRGNTVLIYTSFGTKRNILFNKKLKKHAW